VSTPEPRRDPVPLPQPRRAPAGPTRTVRTLTWVGVHLGELAGVTVPGALAFVWSPWWALGAGAVAVLWAVHEYQDHHPETPKEGDPQ
jgi:hypothetical protein